MTKASINFNFWMRVFSLHLDIFKKFCDHVGGEEGRGTVILHLLSTGVGSKQISVYADLKFRQTSKIMFKVLEISFRSVFDNPFFLKDDSVFVFCLKCSLCITSVTFLCSGRLFYTCKKIISNNDITEHNFLCQVVENTIPRS